jgi:hypothetical protein
MLIAAMARGGWEGSLRKLHRVAKPQADVIGERLIFGEPGAFLGPANAELVAAPTFLLRAAMSEARPTHTRKQEA